nr:hypothetical protein [Tanacetum cinerariifolium]
MRSVIPVGVGVVKNDSDSDMNMEMWQSSCGKRNADVKLKGNVNGRRRVEKKVRDVCGQPAEAIGRFVEVYVSTKRVRKDFRRMTCSQKWSQARLPGSTCSLFVIPFGGLAVFFSSPFNAPYFGWLSHGYPFVGKIFVTTDGPGPLQSRFRCWSLDVYERIMILAGYDPGGLRSW